MRAVFFSRIAAKESQEKFARRTPRTSHFKTFKLLLGGENNLKSSGQDVSHSINPYDQWYSGPAKIHYICDVEGSPTPSQSNSLVASRCFNSSSFAKVIYCLLLYVLNMIYVHWFRICHPLNFFRTQKVCFAGRTGSQSRTDVARRLHKNSRYRL